jgi:SRSO17 transposase
MERHFETRKWEMLAECEVDGESLAEIAGRLAKFVEPFVRTLATKEQRQAAGDYVTGLASDLERKNVESIAYYHQQDRQRLQRFIGCGVWDHQPLLGELSAQVGRTLGEADGVLVFDPSAFTKKGTRSVGVQRQWNGRLGKIDNCQLGVYLAYVSRRGAALTNERLYLPKSWANNRHQRRLCGVPDEIRFATRLELALDMLAEQGAELPHAWVAGDDEFGRSTQFRRDLRVLRERYLLAVPSNTLVCELASAAAAEVQDGPPPLAGFGRVDRWAAQLTPSAWTRVDIRDGAKGPVIVEVAATSVLAMTERKSTAANETLVVIRRCDESGQEVYDYFLASAPADTPAAEFARVANSRQRIEECLQRAKGEAGLADYEVRTWRGWHHHQTLSLLAVWFLTLETQREKKSNAGDHAAPSPRRHRPSPQSSSRRQRAHPYHPRMPPPTGPQRTRPLPPPQTPQLLTTTSCPATELS